MSRKLNIYACSGIGDAEGKKSSFFYDYWLDNTKTVSNTQAVNTLLAMINSNYTDVVYLSLTEEELIQRFNNIDLLCVSLFYAQEYSGKPEELKRAGQVIGKLYADGFFRYESVDNNDRNSHLDELLNKVSEMVGDDTMQADAEFTEWWHEKVVSRDRVGLSKQDQDIINNTLESHAEEMQSITGIGTTDDWKNADIAQYLNNSKDYFMYLFFTEEQLQKMGNKRFITKRKYQQKVYDYCKLVFTDLYGSEDEMRSIIRDSIKATFSCTPEKLCEDIVAGVRSTSAIGDPITWTVEAIIALVNLVLTAVMSIISMILSCVAQIKSAKYAAVSTEIAEAGIPDGDDYSSTGLSQLISKDNSMLLIAGAVALLFIFNKD